MARKTKVSVPSTSTSAGTSSVSNKADILSALPTRVTADIFSSWLDIKSITHLDSAYCNKLSRPFLVAILGCNEFVVKNAVDATNKMLIEWLLKKEIKISSIIFAATSHMCSLSTYLRKWGKYIRTVNAGSCNLSDEMYMLALFCSNITRVWYCTSDISYSFKEMLQNNPNIREIYISGVVMCANDIFNGLTFQKLEILSVDNSSIQRVDEHFPWSVNASSDILQKVHIASYLNDPMLTCLLRRCPNITCLNLFGLTDESLMLISTLQPNIQHLDLSHSAEITEDGLIDACKKFKNLRSLNLMNHAGTLLTDTFLTHLAEHCGHTLEELHTYIDNPESKSTVEILKTFAQKCIVLKKLNISSFRIASLCPEGGTFALVQGLPKLQKLVIHYDKLISHASRQFIGALRPELNIIVDENENCYDVLKMSIL